MTESAHTQDCIAYEVRDDQGDVTEIRALDDSDAEVKATEFVREGDYGDSTTKTFWVDASYRVKPDKDEEDDNLDWINITVTFDPKEPACEDVDGDSEHAWVDGEPRGSGGGAMGTDWCARCGLRRHWDTWAQRMDTGEQGLSSIEYEEQGDTISDRLYRLDVGGLDQTIIGKGEGWSVFLAEAPSPFPWYAIVEQTEDDSPEGFEVSVEWTLSIEDAKSSALELCTGHRESEHAKIAKYRCVSDRYDADGSVLYDSVDDFQAMCVASFGVRAKLARDADTWTDETGNIVLELA